MANGNICSSKGRAGLQELRSQPLISAPSQAVVPGLNLSHPPHTPALQPGSCLCQPQQGLYLQRHQLVQDQRSGNTSPPAASAAQDQLCGRLCPESFSLSIPRCAASALVFLPLEAGTFPWSVAKTPDYLLPAPSLYIRLPPVATPAKTSPGVTTAFGTLSVRPHRATAAQAPTPACFL